MKRVWRHWRKVYLNVRMMEILSGLMEYKNDEMHTRARDNALMSGRWNQRMKIMYQGVGICFRIPKSLRLAYVSFHSAQHTYARQKTREWTVLSFPLSGQSTRKSEDAEEMSRYHSPPHTWQHMRRPTRRIWTRSLPLCQKQERSLPQRVARVWKAWRA